MSHPDSEKSALPSRREVLGAATAAGAAAALMASGNYAFAQGSDTLKVGLVGCGGRGTGAAADALTADPGAVLTAMADVYSAQIENSHNSLKSDPNFGGRVRVPPEARFVGLDAYKAVIESGVDVVLLAAPPGFRPAHIKAAAAAGKHIFAEKPIGTDAVGVRACLDALKAAKPKGKCFVSGFCYRYASTHREFFARLHDGGLGEVRAIHSTYLTGPVKPMPPASARPAGMSDVEWQVRNWYNFIWLSGDGLIEQACHSIDKIVWAMKDEPPLRCVATGGRIFPNNEGNIYDHIDVFYEWPNGVRATMAQRQMPNLPHNDNTDYILGTKGVGTVRFTSAEMVTDSRWRTEQPTKSMYLLEHEALFGAIRKGEQIDDSEKMVRSCLVGLMGRMAAYTGAQVTWEHILQSKEDITPVNLDWNGKLAIAPMPVPGKTPLV